MQIKRLRESHMFTQQQLADALGVARSAIANWESGIAKPRADLLPKLAALFHCTIDELFGEPDNKAPPAGPGAVDEQEGG